MQVPLMADTQGLPEVSSLRKRPVIRPTRSKSFRAALSGSFFLSSAWKVNIDLIIERSAPPEKEDLPEVMTTPLTAGSAVV